MYADLNGWRVNGGTVPQEMALTEQKPDLVVIDKSEKPTKVMLVELTVPWDSANSFQNALERKTARYERLTEDLREAGFKTLNLPLEIGCRGVINQRNATNLKSICNQLGDSVKDSLIHLLALQVPDPIVQFRNWLPAHFQGPAEFAIMLLEFCAPLR